MKFIIKIKNKKVSCMLHSIAFFLRASYSADVSFNWSEPLMDNITDCTAFLKGSYTIDLLALVTFAKL